MNKTISKIVPLCWLTTRLQIPLVYPQVKSEHSENLKILILSNISNFKIFPEENINFIQKFFK